MAEPSRRPLIVKLGGSLAGTSALKSWITALDACDRPLVIVPGGGALADAVRSLQSQLGFDDATAHHMALLAMQQYGLALAAMNGRLVSAATREAIFAAMGAGKIACWNPVPMALADDVPKKWEMTSDSLAAWLAGRFEAGGLLVIKSLDPPAEVSRAADLAKAGIVDAFFPKYAAASRAALHVAGPGALADAEALLAQGHTPGRAIHVG